MFCNNYIDVEIYCYNSFHIDYIISSSYSKWRFTCFYGKPVLSKQKISWDLLQRLHALQTMPWLIARDFNKILKNSEKFGGSNRPPFYN